MLYAGSGWYLRQKPVGGSKAGGLPQPSLSLPPPFHSPKFSDKPVGGKVRSSEGEVPRLPPPYKYHPAQDGNLTDPKPNSNPNP